MLLPGHPTGAAAPALEDALTLAAAAHRGQVYPSPRGEPYRLHPLRVLLRLEPATDAERIARYEHARTRLLLADGSGGIAGVTGRVACSAAMRLVTARLVLREFVEDDWPALYAFESDPEAVRYQSYDPRTAAGCRAMIRRAWPTRRSSPGASTTWPSSGGRRGTSSAAAA